MQYIQWRWRGESTSATGLWIKLVGAFLLLLSLFFLLNEATTFRVHHFREWSGIYLLLILLTAAGGTWQGVKIWRSGQCRHCRKRRLPGCCLARLAMILLAAMAVVTLIDQWRGYLYLGKVALHLEKRGGWSIDAADGGATARLAGTLEYGVAGDLHDFLERRPEVRTVELNSPGGRLQEGLALYRQIRSRRLATRTTEGCFSNCALAFLAGGERSVRGEGRLGFHSVRFPFSQETVVAKATTRLRTVLREKGVSEPFVEKMLATPHEEMWLPDNLYLFREGIVTGVIRDGKLLDHTAYRMARRGDLDRAFRGNPFLATMERRAPASYRRLAEAFLAKTGDGLDQGEVRLLIQGISREILADHFDRTSDAALAGLFAANHRSLASLYERDPDMCWAYVAGVSMKGHSPADLLSADLLRREQEAMARVLEESREMGIGGLPIRRLQEDLQDLEQVMTARFGADFEERMAPAAAQNPDGRAFQCRVKLALGEEIARLSVARRAAVHRATRGRCVLTSGISG